MNEIRAFVGHSFTPDDEEVVATFLKYFSRLSKSHANFSWDHAEAAEPKFLSEKVMSLLSNKNVFIGICTRKERVTADESLTKTFFPWGFLKAQESAFSWKTSDWIIQEIGLAKGKGLELILLVEHDVREPGGLQGDIEYIPFDRDSPEKSFGKLLDMISALSPKDSSPSVASPDSRMGEGQQEHEPPVDEEWLKPKPDWQRDDYEFAWVRMMIVEDTAGIKTINGAYLNTEDASRGDNRESWDAFREYNRLRFGKGGSLADLTALAGAHSRSSGTLAYLAKGFVHYQEHAKAATTFEAAAKEAPDDESQRLLGQAAAEHARAGATNAALAIINEMKSRVEKSGNGELLLLKVLRELAGIAKEDEATLALMERIVEVDSGDSDARFSLAYKHSECGNHGLALLHYLGIPHQQRRAWAWNNLGVEFGELSLPAKSVDAFRTAGEMGQSLAMSNLAKRFTSAGFLREAQKECDRALTIENYHPNVGHALARLKELPDEENETEAELLRKSKPKSNFYRQLGRAMSRCNPSQSPDRWEGPDCVLNVRILGSEFSAEGSYERPPSPLALAMMGGLLSGRDTSSADRFRVEYRGTLRGRAIEGYVTRTKEGAPPVRRTLLGSMEDETKVLMVLADDGSELRVMENPQSKDLRFYELKRQSVNG